METTKNLASRGLYIGTGAGIILFVLFGMLRNRTAVQSKAQCASSRLRRLGTDQNGKVKSKLFSNRSLK